MYPAQTSLIPVMVALTRFLETNGLSAMFSWYPFWYLGVPFKFATGPIVPVALFLLHKVFPFSNLFTLSFVLIGISYIIGIWGWVKLVKMISGGLLAINYLLLTIFLLLFPWRFFSSVALGETGFTVARNLLPLVLVACYLYLKGKTKWGRVVPILVTSLILLISTDVLPILFIGTISLLLSHSYENGKIKGFWKYFKKLLSLLVISLLLITLIWYTPGYWMTLVVNPSLGGLSLGRVVVRVIDLFRGFIPVLLAILAVYFSKKISWSKLTVFTLSWVFSFLFISVYRFLADINFWMDWTSWFYELEVGLVLLLSKTIYDLRFKNYESLYSEYKTPNQKKLTINYYLLTILLFLLPFYLVWRVNLALGVPELLSKNTPEGIKSVDKIAEVVGESRVFLSGSTVFWSGAVGEPLNQLRGGNDKTATNLLWYHAAYQIREGSDPEISRAWLKAFGVEYVLVHTPNSKEYYHDFKNINKWDSIGNVVWEEKGDFLVHVDGVSRAYVVDINALGSVKLPQKGDDMGALENYMAVRKNGINIKRTYNQIVLSGLVIKNGEGISVLESFSSHWKVNNGSVEKDVFGNMLIRPETPDDIVLRYR